MRGWCDTKRMETGLANRHVLITGAAGGIGSETVRLFLEENSHVTAIYHTTEGPLREFEQRWSDQLATIRADITSESDVKQLYENANDRFGRVDVLVANAGIANHRPVGIQNMSLEQWQKTLMVNLTGTFLCAKYFFKNLEEFREEYASLIIVGSTAGVFGEAWFSDYSASKSAMYGLMMSLKNEIVHLAHRGRVNVVNPGWTLTPMTQQALDDRYRVRTILQTIPLRKTAVPRDIASAIVCLASDRLAGHISGQAITIAGGMEGRVLFTPEETGL